MPAGSQASGADRLTIRVVVHGDATAGFTIGFWCFPGPSLPVGDVPNYALRFDFDAAGHPTTAYAPQTTPTIVDDAWVLDFGPGPGPVGCRLAEVTDANPVSVDWTCASTVTPQPPVDSGDPNQPSVFGCLAASGVRADPLLFTAYDAPGDEPPKIFSQTIDATFVNVVVPQPITPIVVAPTFTG